MTIYKGDAIKIPFKIAIGGVVIDETNCGDVEIAIGNYIKNYRDGEIYCTEQKWYFPLSQEETFAFSSSKAQIQIRVLLPDGTVRGVDVEPAEIVRNISKEVLTDG